MININLLPESMRRKEGMPQGQKLALLLCLALAGSLVYMVSRYHLVIIPELKQEKKTLAMRKSALEAKAQELKDINKEIDRMSGYVDAVKGLYKQRIVWAKVMSDIKNIVNFDKTMSEYNTDHRYIWLSKITGKEKSISLNCFASASSQVLAMQMPERLLQGFRDYSPINLPEKDEEERLQEELKNAVRAHENERRENPNLPLQGTEELEIKARLEEIKSVKSGGIALLPFNELLVPGSLQLTDAKWGKAPTVSGMRDEIKHLYPDNAWAFSIVMTLK